MPIESLDVSGSPLPKHRRAFSLLEMLLSASIAMILLAAVYAAMSTQLRLTQSGRDDVEQSQVARGLLRQMTNDINQSIAPVRPNLTQSSSSSSSPSSSSTSGTGSTSSTTSSSTASSSSTSSSSGSSTTSSSSSGTTSTFPTYNLGLQGDNTTLTVYISRVPRELTYLSPTAILDNSNIPIVSDLRSVSYGLAGGTDAPLGLARRELTGLASLNDPTTDPRAAIPPQTDWDPSEVEAKEVKYVWFRYFDGTNWNDTWDGTQVGPDGVTPIGPPVAIEITLKIAPPGDDGSDEQTWKTYRHVVFLTTANGATTQALGSTSQ